jgi:hypothetical protein
MTVLSIDLAYKRYSDIGVCVLCDAGDRIEIVPIRLVELGLKGAPTIGALAKTLVRLAEHWSARLVLIDGSQAWKSPDNGLPHCRICERALATQGKTGLPGVTKPAGYAAFISFAIELFDELSMLGWPRVPSESALRSQHPFALESFPTSAWRSLGLTPLPAKARTRDGAIQARLEELGKLYPVSRVALTHDELQAVIAGLAGLGIEGHPAYSYTLAGVAPFELDDAWREGFIVNPVRSPR